MEVVTRRLHAAFLEKFKFAEDEIPPKNPFPVPVRRPSSDFLEIKILFKIILNQTWASNVRYFEITEKSAFI